MLPPTFPLAPPTSLVTTHGPSVRIAGPAAHAAGTLTKTGHIGVVQLVQTCVFFPWRWVLTPFKTIVPVFEEIIHSPAIYRAPAIGYPAFDSWPVIFSVVCWFVNHDATDISTINIHKHPQTSINMGYYGTTF